MNIKQRFIVNFRGYKMIHKLIPGYMLFSSLNALCNSVFPFINIYMSARIINAFIERKSLNDILIMVGITVFANLITALIRSITSRVADYRGARAWDLQKLPLYEKIQNMDFENVEDAQVHAKLHLMLHMMQTNGYGLNRLIWTFRDLTTNFFTIIISIMLVITAFTSNATLSPGNWSFIFTWWFSSLLILIILLGVIFEFIRSMAIIKKYSTFFSSFSGINRVWMYIIENLFNYKIGKDLRLYNLTPMMTEDMKNINKLMLNAMKRFWYVLAGFSCIQVGLSTFLTVLSYCYVAVKAYFGAFPIGNIVQYVGALTRFGQGFWGLGETIGQLWTNTEMLQMYFDFIDTPEKKYQGTLHVEKRIDNEYEIEFHNVSFKYPGSEVYVLKNFNLKLNIGQKLAVVGMNGSGKTTMIKLLCRLYDPTEGEITLNGIDIKKYKYHEYLHIFSVAFQDFKLFSFPLGQNIAANMEVDIERLSDCLKKAGLESGHLTSDTCLYKDFDENGIEISGGEAQKIALARALYKDAPFIVLDEPTAALDPIAEFEIYTKFNDIVGDKTAIYISHRLSSCRFCDDIAVFHEGEMVERGNHDTLIANINGKYYELWNAQAQYYTD